MLDIDDRGKWVQREWELSLLSWQFFKIKPNTALEIRLLKHKHIGKNQ